MRFCFHNWVGKAALGVALLPLASAPASAQGRGPKPPEVQRPA